MNTLAKNSRQSSFRGAGSLTFILIAGLSSISAISQESAQTPSIETCQAIQSASSRLSCYDKLFNVAANQNNGVSDSQVPAIKSAPVTNSDANNVRFIEPAASRAPTPRLTDNNVLTQSPDEFRKSKSPEVQKEVVKSVSSEIVKTQEYGYRKLRFFLKNGQVWDQIDTVTIRAPKISKSKPKTAEIRKGAISSYYLQVDGKGRAVKVRRSR